MYQSFRANLNDQVNQLASLQWDDDSPIDLHNYHLQSIFHILFREYDNCSNELNLTLPELSKLTESCIKVIDPRRFKRIQKDSWTRCEVLAIKILILVMRRKNYKIQDQSTFGTIYNTLIEFIRLPDNDDDLGATQRASKLASLSACCLSLIDYEKVLTPDEANQLTNEKLLPLAIYYLNKESIYERNFLDVLMGVFHGIVQCRENLGDVLTNASPITYPWLVQLLLAVMRCFKSDQQDHGEKFKAMLKIAHSSNYLCDEYIVVLNVLLAHHRYREDGLDDELGQVVLDLLSKSVGLQRAHMAFLCRQTFRNKLGPRDRFIKIMVDDLLTEEDKLVYELNLKFIGECGEEVSNWEEILSGKEMKIIERLIELVATPENFHLFLRNFQKSRLKDSEFDQVTLKPISQFIDELFSFRELRTEDRYGPLKARLECLGSFLRLRHHRLGENLELRLNQALELIFKDEDLRFWTLVNNGELFSATNSYQVYPSAWNSILDFVRYAEPSWWCIDIGMVLSYLLMVDKDTFYKKIASIKVFESIYKICEQIIESDSILTPIEEILITWPGDHVKTHLDSDERQVMLNKFIKLVVINIPKRVRMSERLSGLMAAFCFHREALLDILEELEHEHKIDDRNAWLKGQVSMWVQIVIDDGKPIPVGSQRIGSQEIRDTVPTTTLDKFANIVIASEGYKVIKEDLHAYSDLRESSGAMLKVIKAALARAIERTPVDSMESKRYKLIQASSPIN